jgi:hypothetical protein
MAVDERTRSDGSNSARTATLKFCLPSKQALGNNKMRAYFERRFALVVHVFRTN